MALRDALAPIIKLILMIAYGAYVAFGLLLFILGIYYTSSVEGANDFVTIVAMAGGFFMMVVGGIGIFANLKTNTLLIFVALIMDIAIFIFLLAACIVGIFIANEISDPVAQGVQEAYCDDPRTSNHIYCDTPLPYDPENPGITIRVSNWNGVVSQFGAGSPPSCKDFNDQVIAQGDAVNLAAEACGFSDCGTDACVAVPGNTVERCQCVTEIVAREPYDEIATAECDITQGSSETATTCTDVVAAAPAGCMEPAPVDTSDPPIWSQSMGLVSGSCETDTGCADEANFETPTACTTDATGCAVTDENTMDGTCTLKQPRAAAGRVLGRAAVVQICPLGCLAVQQQDAVEAVDEACTPIRGYTEARCVGSTGATTADLVAECAAADTEAACTAVATATNQCVYLGELVCTIGTDSATTGLCETESTGFTASDCHYTPQVEAQDAVQADCTSAGTAGDKTYPGAKEASVTDSACTGTDGCVTQAVFMGNCTAVDEMFTGTLTGVCNTCWDHWQYKVIDEVKGNLWPATVTIFALFLFMLILVCLNYYMIDNQEDDDGSFSPGGIFKILGFVFNGVVMLFGLIVIIIGAIVLSDLDEGCPAGKDCTNTAVVGLIIVGVFVFLTAIVSLVGIILAGMIGMMLLRIANLVFLILGLFLLMVGIAFTIIAGAMDSINKQYEDNFDTVRAQYEQEDPNTCAGLDNEACKKKIKTMAAESNTVIVVLMAIICFSFLFVTFLTLEAFYIYKGGDDDDDDDDDE